MLRLIRLPIQQELKFQKRNLNQLTLKKKHFMESGTILFFHIINKVNWASYLCPLP